MSSLLAVLSSCCRLLDIGQVYELARSIPGNLGTTRLPSRKAIDSKVALVSSRFIRAYMHRNRRPYLVSSK